MDEVIFEEFKGTGNMEVILDRRIADRRSTRRSTRSAPRPVRKSRLLSPDGSIEGVCAAYSLSSMLR